MWKSSLPRAAGVEVGLWLLWDGCLRLQRLAGVEVAACGYCHILGIRLCRPCHGGRYQEVAPKISMCPPRGPAITHFGILSSELSKKHRIDEDNHSL